MSDELPEGFTLDAPTQSGGGELPEGFTLDAAPQAGTQTVANPFQQQMPGVMEAAQQGFAKGFQGVKETGQALSGETPTAATQESPAAAPYEFDWYPHASGISKTAYRLAENWPTLGGGIFGGVAGSAIGPEGSLAGGALGAATANAAQTLGPFYAKRLKETPDDKDGAFNRALEDASISGAFSGAGWALFPAKFFTGPVKNLITQATAVQPAVGIAQQAVTNIRNDQPVTQNMGNAYVESAIGTAVPMLGHAAVSGIAGKGEAPKAEEAAPEATAQPEPPKGFTPDKPAATGTVPETAPEDPYPNAPQDLKDVLKGENRPSFFTPAESPYKVMTEDTGIPKDATITDDLAPDKAKAGGFEQIPDGPIGRQLHKMVEGIGIGDIVQDIQMNVTPMAARNATIVSRAAAKDFANYQRFADVTGHLAVKSIEKNFKPDEFKTMWDAADEQSVLMQKGEDTAGKGLDTLTPEQRDAVKALQDDNKDAWDAHKAAGGLDSAEGLPSYVPRNLVNEAGERPTKSKTGYTLDQIGQNLNTTTQNLKRRKYLTTEETEAAGQEHFGEDYKVLRDIRTLPLTTAALRKATAGLAFVNKIKEIGKQAGEETVHEGIPPSDSPSKWFTLNHPALTKWKIKLDKGEDGKLRAKNDEDGNPLFDKVPLYIRSDFEGPARAVLSTGDPGAAYKALMEMKNTATGMIMISPAIHMGVVISKALPVVKTRIFKAFRDGATDKNDPTTMREFTLAGGAPIRNFRNLGGDFSDLMTDPGLSADKGWLTKGLRKYVGGMPADAAGKFLHFWHETLLWDQVASLQMGLYTNFRDQAIKEGHPPDVAQKMAAHMSNRAVGSMPNEALSSQARKLANLTMFSRSYTLGNIGFLKDMFMGLPSDVQAQIARDHGVDALLKVRNVAQRKAIEAFMVDAGLYYASNAIFQHAANNISGSGDDFIEGYAKRLSDYLNRFSDIRENPMGVLVNPFTQLSPTRDNEFPGRIKVGRQDNGTAIYARNPLSKYFEELQGYFTEPIDEVKRKQSTLLKPFTATYANDKGFGRKIYNDQADTPMELLGNAGRIASYFVQSQLPVSEIEGAKTLITGEGDADTRRTAALQTFGPFGGLMFRQGYPGGEAAGLEQKVANRQQFYWNEAKPDVRKMIKSGDTEGAQQRMTELGVPQNEQKGFIKSTLNPGNISQRKSKIFGATATEEEKQQLERIQGQASGGSIRKRFINPRIHAILQRTA